MKKITALVLSLVLILGIFSGCSKSGSTTSAAPGAKKENVFTFTRQADMNTWNTFMGTDTNSVLLNRFIYDTLVIGDRKGGYTPGLATSWTTSSDGKTWTLKLRTDVKFHNGDTFSSADVKYTFERYAKDKTVRSLNDWTALDSVATPDAQTAVFTFTSVPSSFMNSLIDTYVVDSKYVTASGDKAAFEKPVGTGPWKFVSWQPGQKTEFIRNDEYWNWGDSKSNVDRVIFRPILEDTTRLAAIQTGDVDLAEALNNDQAKQLQAVKGVKVDSIMTSAMANLQFKFVNSIFADEKVRQAASLAINRQQIVDTIAGGKALSWNCTSTDLGYKEVTPVFDPAKAKQLLSESSYKGQAFKIYAVTGQLPRSTEILQTISAMLNAVGFNSSVQFMESAALSAQRTAGNYDCYIVSGPIVAGDPTPNCTQRWLNDLFKSGFKDEKMFALIKQANTELDAKKRGEIMQQVLQISYDTVAPGVALYQIQGNYAYKDNVSGLKIFPDGMNDYTRVMKK